MNNGAQVRVLYSPPPNARKGVFFAADTGLEPKGPLSVFFAAAPAKNVCKGTKHLNEQSRKAAIANLDVL